MLDAVVWGLVQGLTEFLPISSSGHLVLLPAFLSRAGIDVGDPDLATTAVLHLGTLLAVLAYYRTDILGILKAPNDPRSRRLVFLIALGSVPALIGLPLRGVLGQIEENPTLVGVALIATGLILAVGSRWTDGDRRLESGTARDAIAVGLAQALALVPGISRSGSTITAGLMAGFDREEAARFSFLLAIPAIAGGGLISLLDVTATSVAMGPVLVGLLVAAVAGYAAIAVLIRLLVSRGFGPFVSYCLVVGAAAVIIL
ncbi:MAG TPA: undecaprenyl-diphosphate phosphatase [Acidimicrobiia bacterium]|nr:undecaprenyl-diphosphate phosphatase [Acidimicrobiia bacterium]